MRKIFFTLIPLFLLLSCAEEKQKPVLDESFEIIGDYSDTLETSIEDAKTVQKLIDSRNNNIKNNLGE